MIYEIILNKINRGGYDKEDLTRKLNLFLLYDQITEDHYKECIELMK